MKSASTIGASVESVEDASVSANAKKKCGHSIAWCAVLSLESGQWQADSITHVTQSHHFEEIGAVVLTLGSRFMARRAREEEVSTAQYRPSK